MVPTTSTFSSFLLFSYTVSALAVGGFPAITTGIESRPHSWGSHTRIATFRPTPAPYFHALRRQQTSQPILLAAPANTCGYISASSALPWGCDKGENCLFATASQAPNSTKTAGSVLCCDPASGCPAAAPTACVDKGRYDYNTTCTGICPEDPMTLKCTAGINIYCNTIVFPTPLISALYCDYLSAYTAFTAETSYVGQVDHAFTPTTAIMIPLATPTPTPSSSTSKPSNSRTSASATPTEAPSGPQKPVDKNAIVGGVVGAVVGISVGAGLMLLYLRRNRQVEEVKTISPPVGRVLIAAKNTGKTKMVSFTVPAAAEENVSFGIAK